VNRATLKVGTRIRYHGDLIAFGRAEGVVVAPGDMAKPGFNTVKFDDSVNHHYFPDDQLEILPPTTSVTLPSGNYEVVDHNDKHEWASEEEKLAERQHREDLAASVRAFATGATRDTDAGKLDYEGFFSPAVLLRRAQYMNKHRVQSDGKLRDSDNWQKGMPFPVYAKSLFRHFVDFWTLHRTKIPADAALAEAWQDAMEETLCAIMFNAEGYLHELRK